MINRPIIGPKKSLPIEYIKDLVKEKTFNLVKAIPNYIKIKKIAAYIKRNVVFSTNTGNLILK